jgi:hypothetical protein
MNIQLPKNLPLYTYTFVDEQISLDRLDSKKFTINTKSNIGKIKILFVCDNLFKYGGGMGALLYFNNMS